MHKLLLTLLICFTFCAAKSQNNDLWQAGSAYSLDGKIYTLTCFISTPENRWTAAEKKQACFKINNAKNWLMFEAHEYNIHLQFDDGVWGLQNDISFDTIDDGNAGGKNPNDWVSRVIEKAGSSTPLEVYDSIKKATGCDNVQVIILAKQKGRGYATPYRSDASKAKFFLEGAILYAKDNLGGDLKTASIAHEMLHLYGAWDLYTTYAQTEEKETKAKEIYPNDIMLRSDPKMSELEVAELTAWLVGWKKETHPIYEFFRPENRKGDCCSHQTE
jgi:hypothetical protein